MTETRLTRQHLFIGAGCLMMGIMIGATLSRANRPPANDAAVLSYHGLDYTVSALPANTVAPLKALRCEQTRALEKALLEAGWQLFVIDLAQKHQLSLAQAEAKALAIDAVTDSEVEALYAAHQAQWKQPLFVLREGLRQRLTDARLRRAKQAKIAELQTTGELILLTPSHCDSSDTKSEHPLT